MGRLSGWPLLMQRVVTTLGFTLLRFIYMAIQTVYWHINGTKHRIRESRLPENYNRCAHVLDIVLFNRLDLTHTGSIKDYILSHNRFESPQYIFDNDHVSLVTINEDNAIFGVAKQKDMHLWKFEYCCFMRAAQVLHCNQLILVPLNHFHRMAEELGDPKAELIFLANTGRCGSTLLSQMMQTTGKCISISEPDSLNFLALCYKSKGDSQQLRKLTQDIIRWTCRPYKNITPLAYFLKIMPTYCYVLPILRKVYPCSKYLFMYRNLVQVGQSFARVSREVPTLLMMNTLGKLSAVLSGKCLDYLGYSLAKDFRYKFWDDLSMGILRATVNCKLYLEWRSNGLEVSAVRYEDIMKDKHFAARTILKFYGLPISLEQDFLRGLEFDSQQN